MILVNLFGILLAVLLGILFIGAPCVLAWFITGWIQKSISIIRTLNAKPVETLVDSKAREHMKQMRDAQDAIRLARVIQRRTVTQTVEPPLVLPGLPCEHPPTSEPLYLICRDPFQNPTFFHSIRWGRHPVNEPRIFFSPLRSCALRLTRHEAEKTLKMLDPKGGVLFIVPQSAIGPEMCEQDLTGDFESLSSEARNGQVE